MYLKALARYFDTLHVSEDPDEMIRIFPPLVHSLLLVWTHSAYELLLYYIVL